MSSGDLDVVRRELERIQASREDQGRRIGKVEERLAVVDRELEALGHARSQHEGDIRMLLLGAEGVKSILAQGVRTEAAIDHLRITMEKRLRAQDDRLDGHDRSRAWIVGAGVATATILGALWAIFQFVVPRIAP